VGPCESNGVVPFVGRELLLDQLMLWRESERAFDVAVLVGGGGYKTRTAAEVCQQAPEAG